MAISPTHSPLTPHKIGIETRDRKEIRNLVSGPTGKEDQPNGVHGEFGVRENYGEVSTGILNPCFRRQIRG